MAYSSNISWLLYFTLRGFVRRLMRIMKYLFIFWGLNRRFTSYRPTHYWLVFTQHYNLDSHTTYVVCVNFIHKWPDVQFKVDSEQQIYLLFLRNFSMQFYYTLWVFGRRLLRWRCRGKNFVYFVQLMMSYLEFEMRFHV